MSEASLESHSSDKKSEAPQLTDIELRVLGALMEKELATPDQYPLTLNSLINACNQKSNREPVSSHSQGDIARTLIELENNRFVKREYGSRVERYTQQFMSQLDLGRKHQALLCVMMLRGPQTISELSTRTQRMIDFSDKAEIEHTIARLCERETPFAIRLAARPGQRGDRIGHLFNGTPRGQPVSDAQPSFATTQQRSTSGAPDIKALEAQVSALTAETDKLRQQIEALYQLTGHALSVDSDE